jgi:putative flavoprotein involved in K+ transport
MARPERFDTVIVGAGQAGLAVGHFLARQGRSFVILDAAGRIGDSWRRRWDSLRLFTPGRYDGLPGRRYPGPAWSFPGKDEIADFLEDYAERFQLPVRTSVRVDRLAVSNGQYALSACDDRFHAANVVVATGAFGTPRLPSFASELDADVRQLHSDDYRNPTQLRDGPVLVVGAGNSGAEIALEVSRTHPAWLSGRPTGTESPFRVGSVPDRLLTPVAWLMLSRVLTTRTPPGRALRRKALTMGTPLVRVKPKDIADADVECVPKTTEVRDGLPVLSDGRVMSVTNVIWCTGYRPDFDWIDIPVLADDGTPLHDRGVVPSQPGLYFVGQHFLSSLTSALIGGVGRDAKQIAKHIASNPRPA